MAVLADVERFLERVFERSTARLFRAHVQPVQLERRVERAMERARSGSGGRTVVPARYRVRVQPDDLHEVAEQAGGGPEALAGRLADAALTFARAHAYHLPSRPGVSLVADPSLAARAGRGRRRGASPRAAAGRRSPDAPEPARGRAIAAASGRAHPAAAAAASAASVASGRGPAGVDAESDRRRDRARSPGPPPDARAASSRTAYPARPRRRHRRRSSSAGPRRRPTRAVLRVSSPRRHRAHDRGRRDAARRSAGRATTASSSPTPRSRATTAGSRPVAGRSSTPTSAAPTARASTGSGSTSARSGPGDRLLLGDTVLRRRAAAGLSRVDGFVLTLWLVRLLFLLVLYAFLFAVVRVLLRDLRAASRGPAELGRLVVLASPQGEPPAGLARSRSTP